MNRRTTISREAIAASGAVTLEDDLQQGISEPLAIGRRYFSQAPASVDTPPAAEPAGEPAPAVAEPAPAVAGVEPAATPAVSAQPAASAEETVSIPIRNFEELGFGKDINQVIAAAKNFQGLERDGYVELAARAGEKEMDGFFLLSSLLTSPQAQTPAGQAAVQQAAQQAGEQVQQQAADQGVYMTKEDADRYIDQKLNDHFTQRDQQTTLEGQVGEEQSRYDSILTEIGFAKEEHEVEIAGKTSKMDAVREFVLLPVFRALTQNLIDSRLNSSDPAYAEKRNQPASAEIQALAAKDVQTVMALIGSISLETIANTQANLPATTGGEGPAGRAQTDNSKLTPEQRRNRGFQSAKAKGKLQGEYPAG